jgi:hypothetical protein
MDKNDVVFYLEELYEILVVSYSEVGITDGHLNALEYAVEELGG